MKVRAPGKLILAGEHAVVYGCPALAMAVNRHVTAVISHERRSHILFDLADLGSRSRLSMGALRHLKARVKRKYHRFRQGDFRIRDVLRQPFELAQFALGFFVDSLNIALPHGVKICVSSDIPIGCGMGSSAATIVSVMYACKEYFSFSLTEESLFQLALEAENMQHGYSSGLDLQVAIRGGCLLMHQQKIETRPLPNLPLYLIHTGTPQCSTGECVERVRPQFQSSALVRDFTQVSTAMDSALQQHSASSFREAIQANHRLLVEIGVVPARVQDFIKRVESLPVGAAKICGAGAIVGEHAGMVLVTTEDPQALELCCQQFAYSSMPIAGEQRGVHAS